MAGRTTGQLITVQVGGERYSTYTPHPLPPEPPLNLTPEDQILLGEADRALGRLDGITPILPDPDLFIYFYIRKEALMSSQIEGTQSSLSDLLLFENEDLPNAPLDDVQEVSNYVQAMGYGLKRLKEGFPLSIRLLKEIHAILLREGRGGDRDPGEFRRSQNWIGGSRPGNARYVPPPPQEVPECMGRLERFLHNAPVRTPVLIKAALAHVQFESIHPFLDGNGRLGRLLITLLLCSEEALERPVLYLSLYLKQNRDAYYDFLQRVRTEGAWEEWVRFFLQGVVETSRQSHSAAHAMLTLFREHRALIDKLGRAVGSTLRVYEYLQRQPISAAAKIIEHTGLSVPTVHASLRSLEDLGIVRELTGRQRYRYFSYSRYLDILSEGTEPII